MVKERLGHGSIRTTEGYLHFLPGAQDAALTALDAVRGNRSNVKTDEATVPATAVGTGSGADE